MNPKKSILLVDDERSIRLLLSAVLERFGYSVEVAEDGYAALQKLSRALPDIVITDLRMPNMNGFELLAVLRSRYPEIPSIVISGEFIAEQLNAGPIADAFFQKGHYSPVELQEKIAQLLQTPQRRAATARSQGTLWTSTGDASVMLTCTKCLRTFPIQLCNEAQGKMKICIFCGAELEVEVVAIGVAPGER